MSFLTEKLSNENIVIHTLNADFDAMSEIVASTSELVSVLDSLKKPAFVILDTTEAQFSFEGILVSSNTAKQQNIYTHPNFREMLFVTRDDAVAFSTKGMDSAAFGFVKMRLFPTVERALAYARSQPDT